VHETRRVEWLELFFDLVFVVVVAQLTERIESEPGPVSMLVVAGLFLAVWAAWNNTTLYGNIAGELPRRWRPLIFVSMAGVATMAVAIPSIDGGGQVIFAIGYALARTAMWPLWTRVHERLGRFSLVGQAVYGPGLAAGWILSIALPSPWRIGLWALLLLLEIIPTIIRLPAAPQDKAHMSERVGLFVMIVLGESVLELIRSITHHVTAEAWVVGGLGFAVVCALWWRYFEITGEIRTQLDTSASRRILRDIMVGAHYAFVLALIFLAAGLGGAILSSSEPHLPDDLRVLLITGLALYEAAQVLMALRLGGTRPRWVLLGLLPTAVACLVLALAAAFWPPWLVIAVVLLECACEIGVSALIAPTRTGVRTTAPVGRTAVRP